MASHNTGSDSANTNVRAFLTKIGAHYLGREYYFHGMHDKAIAELKRHLSLPSAAWKPERAASMRFIGRCSRGADKEKWFIKACEEYPGSRDALVDLADYYYQIKDWQKCLVAAKKALSIAERPLEYMNDAEAWGYKPYDFAALSSYYLGLKKDALKYGEEALKFEPENERLQTNIQFYAS